MIGDGYNLVMMLSEFRGAPVDPVVVLILVPGYLSMDDGRPDLGNWGILLNSRCVERFLEKLIYESSHRVIAPLLHTSGYGCTSRCRRDSEKSGRWQSLLFRIAGRDADSVACGAGTNWESIVLIAAMMPMSFALEKTGVSETVSVGLVDALGGIGPHWLMAGIYFTTSLLTLFISNTATSVLMAPIAVQSAVAYGVSPLPMLFAVTFGASLCFMSPFSTPPNALVMPAGQYTFMDYVKVGAPLQLLLGILMIFVIPLFFPF